MLVGTLFFLIRAPAAAGQTESPADPVRTYDERIAANDAAAEAWKAGNAPADNAPTCSAGAQLWHRDRVTTLCAPPCATDADCAADERCRIVDLGDTSKVVELPLVDELTPEERDEWMLGADPDIAPVMLCDPFWEFDGAVDADLIDVAPEE